MRLALIVSGLIVLVAGAIALSSVSSPSTSVDEQSKFSLIEQEVSQDKAKLLDVRTPQEFAAGHIEGAENFSLQDLQAGKKPSVPTSQKLYVYCQSGNRSAQATVILEELGYSVDDLGGIGQVASLGGKIIKS